MVRTCILTVVKNEQEYLDEWIKYHLNLGIDHIFILEDTDSDSHKEITDKYGDKVTLDSVLSVFDTEEQIEEAKSVKELNKYSVQHPYFRNGLNMLKKKYSDAYDWCFLIDNDEFITLENDKLEDVLSQFNDYEALVMSWKCYGANGLIHKPNKGVVESFTKEAEGKIPNQTKSCYRIKSFRNEFLYSHHCPTDICNWCNTDFQKSKNTTYNKLYLRHYITKSWEEYVWKRKVRGYVWGRERDFDYFFKLNPDMLPIKDFLINQIKDEVLVVMPYRQGGSQGNEIRLSLSGWRKFCQFKYRFVVIGEYDESLVNEFPWARFIECPTKARKEGQYNPHLDIQNKFKAIARLYAQEYEGFIYMTDDEYAVKPFELSDITRIHYHNKTFIGNEKAPKSFWSYDKWKTRQLLDREGLPHINYTTHYPYYMEFKKLDEIQKKFNLFQESYVFDDVYFNYFEHEEPMLDCEVRLGIWNNDIFKNEFDKALENPKIKFMCNSVEGWSKELEDKLMSNGNG